ncbi:hypothetical protein SDC9_174359 [bioreactor metagenome]|uniref:Uncharacterized protein n=1 Tax=bioreactor metagenome TaxID=1076179 RepID=A0A645GTH3_9ZZZZ
MPGSGKRLSVRLDYPHNHTECWTEETVFDFAAAALEGRDLPSLSRPAVEKGIVSCRVSAAGRNIASAALFTTRAGGVFPDRVWRRTDMAFDGEILSVPLPLYAKAAFFSLFTEDGCCYTSEITEPEE